MIDYHKNNTNTQGQYIVSHSHLCQLDPALGGHPKSFYKALNTPDSFQTPSMEKGDLLHAWIQHKDSFIISDKDKPTEQVSKLVERFYNLYIKEVWKADPVFINSATQKLLVDPDDVESYKTLFKAVTKEDANFDNGDYFQLLVRCFISARKDVAYNKGKLWATVVKDFIGAIEYFEFLKEANGMIILTPSTRDILTNCHESIRRHPFANKLLFEMEGEHEKEYFWRSNNGLNRKGKLDKLIIRGKTLIIPDVKTTAYPVSTYANGEYNPYYKYANGRQLVNYADGFFANNSEENWAEWDVQLYNIVVQTTDEYPTMVYRTSNRKALELRDDLHALERRAIYHIENNIWDISREEHESKDAEYLNIGTKNVYSL